MSLSAHTCDNRLYGFTIFTKRSANIIQTTRPAQWVEPIPRLRRVLEQIDPTRQPNRIRADKPTDIRIVEPEGVVVQPGFAVQVLALEAQVLLFDEEAFLCFGQGVAPNLVAGLPLAEAN